MQKVLEPAGIRTALLTGGLTAKKRRQVLEGLADGSIQAVVGTYALIQDKVVFHSLALAITVFAWTTIIGMYYSCEKSVNYAFGDTQRNKIGTRLYMFYYMVPCVVLYHARADALWAMTDILSAIYVMITILFIVTQQKEIFRLFNDFWFRFLPAKEQGENPPVVSYGTLEDEGRVQSEE
jgi:Na+/alanine symporter